MIPVPARQHAETTGVWLSARAVLIGLCICAAAAPALGAFPAGGTNAVLSFVDSVANHVTLVRHWPEAPQDVDVLPFTPYFWNSCLPGDGAILMLLVGPGYTPPAGTSAEGYTQQYLASLSRAIAAGLELASSGRDGALLRGVIVGITTPGDPAYEQLKEALLSVNDLVHYESYGYAVFLLWHWKWVWPVPGCYPDVVTVPEGYGVPLVSQGSPCRIRFYLDIFKDSCPLVGHFSHILGQL